MLQGGVLRFFSAFFRFFALFGFSRKIAFPRFFRFFALFGGFSAEGRLFFPLIFLFSVRQRGTALFFSTFLGLSLFLKNCLGFMSFLQSIKLFSDFSHNYWHQIKKKVEKVSEMYAENSQKKWAIVEK